MGVIIPKESAFAQERVKFEAQHTEFGPPGRPYHKHEFPKMLFRARRSEDTGKLFLVDQEIAHDSNQEASMRSHGFSLDPDAAFKAVVDSEREIATLAAERTFTERRMSPQAQAEAAAVDAATDKHVAEIPEQPKAPRRLVGAAARAHERKAAEAAQENI